MKYIYSHLGLGDHIICNGLYRELIKKNEFYKIFVKKNNIDSVSFMLKDINNLEFIIVNSDDDVRYFIINNKINIGDLIIIGFCNFPFNGAMDFDDSFYLQHNIDFSKRWDSFICERDMDRELSLFSKFNIIEGEYVFLHDDIDRGYEIDISKINNKDLPIVRPIKGLTNNAFDYCYLMENSKESHFIDSSFKLIFDSFLLRNENIFYHIRLKNNIIKDINNKSQSKLDFKIYE